MTRSSAATGLSVYQCPLSSSTSGHYMGWALPFYCWSSGGADYARESAEEFGLTDCFTAFLPKPNVLLDDQNVADWRRLRQVHPNECAALVDDLREEKEATG